MASLFDKNSERREFPGGLRAQLLLGLLLLVVGTMALVALVGTYLTRSQVERGALQRTAADARVLAELARRDRSDRAIEAVRRRANLAFARVDRGGEIASFGRLPGGVSRSDLPEVPDGSASSPRVETRSLGGDSFALATLARDGNDDRPEVHILVLRPLAPYQQRIAAAQRMWLAYLGIDALFILIVGYAFFTYLVVRPIRAIGVATERAARGDLASHIDVLPPNEFGRVGRSFNRMLDELRENREELERRLRELDEAYNELEQTQESLIRSEKMASVGQLAAGVAHEVGNPLSAISGYLELLQDMDLDDEKRRDLVDRMQDQVDRIQTIIRDLLDFSRDDADSPIEAVELRPCVDEALDLFAPQPRSREIDVSADWSDDLPEVRGNRDQIVQVVINLLMNGADAIKRDDDEGTIDIRADDDGDRVLLRIADDGPGIPEDARSDVFDPFYTTKDPGEGTGLGLAIAHRIMERFDGAVAIEETSSDGTVFRLEFDPADAETSDGRND